MRSDKTKLRKVYCSSVLVWRKRGMFGTDREGRSAY